MLGYNYPREHGEHSRLHAAVSGHQHTSDSREMELASFSLTVSTGIGSQQELEVETEVVC